MNTLNDLRSTLDAHAADIHDDAGRARVLSVHGRARAVRRRRAVSVGGAAAVAVVGALVLPQVLGGGAPVPTDRELIGKVAPASLQSLGHTYRFVEGEENLEGNASIRLQPSDAPRLVTWASDADEVSVYTTVEGETTASNATDFDDFAFVDAGGSGRWTVRSGGEASAIAVYDLDPDQLPAGTTVEGLTFRDQVGDEQLVDVVAGPEGAAEATLTVTVPDSERIRIAEFCQGVPSGQRLWVNLSIDGDGALSSGGCDDDAFDPATGNTTLLEPRHLPDPGEPVEIRMWISRGLHGEPTGIDGSRLALAAYEVGPPAAVLAGWEMPQVYEFDGHLWSLVEVSEAGAGSSRVDLVNDSGAPALAIGAHEGTGRPVSMTSTAGDGVIRNSLGDGMSEIDVLAPGESATVTARGEMNPQGRLGVALYERLD